MIWHHVGIQVDDLEKSLLFYQDILGFSIEQTMELDGEKIAFLQRDSIKIELIEGEEATETMTGCNVHFSWEVPEIAYWIDYLKTFNVIPVEGPYELKNGWKTVFFEGPNLEMIELIEVKQQ